MLRFDFAAYSRSESPLVFSDPLRVIAAYQLCDVLPALRQVQEAADSGHYAAGFVAYEAAPAFDPAMIVPPASPLPLVWFGVFSEPLLPPDQYGEGRHESYSLSDWEPNIAEADYAAAIAEIRAGIGRGEFYQVNHTLRLRARFTGDDFAWYERLRAAQRAPYSAYLDLGRYRILSVSPELFFLWNGERIVTRPMKGTAPRGRWPEEDAQRAQALAASEKERAENLMIVDLLRNDLGRIARFGSVTVESLFEVERYPTVLQMTSAISATLDRQTSITDIFRALFPCGSVTGAPKISAMNRIAALESAPRGIYCGAIGYLTPHGKAIFNVGIRTVTVDRETGMAEFGVGSGITWDSTAEGEYAESRIKAHVLTADAPCFDLLETLLLERGDFFLLDRHLERLYASARYFDFAVEPESVRNALVSYASCLNAEAWRVRLTVSRSGVILIAHTSLLPPRSSPLRIALAPTPVSRQDRLLYHKTTWRATYETRRAECGDADEALLCNQEGELTEFTTGNLVLELDGRRWTPALDSGLLPGTLRAELLKRGEIAERVLHPADLERASSAWLINSVRGWIPVSRIDAATSESPGSYLRHGDNRRL